MKKKAVLFIVFVVSYINIYSQEVNLSIMDRIEGLSRLWKEVSYNFAYPERLEKINWDSLYISCIPRVEKAKTTADYYDVLKKMIVKLDNSHTDIYITPDVVHSEMDSYQLKLAYVEGKICVVNMPESLQSVIPRGSVIIEIDSTESLKYLKMYYFDKVSAPSLQSKMNLAIEQMGLGIRGSSITFTYVTPDNRIKSLSLIRNMRQKLAEKWAYPNELWDGAYPRFKMLSGNIAYLRCISFQNSQVDTLSRLLDTHWNEIKGSESIIIDLRGNIGGTDYAWMRLAKHLCKGDSLKYGMLRSRISSSFYKAKGAFADSTLTSMIGIKSHDSEYAAYYRNKAYEDIPVILENDIPESDKLSQPVCLLVDSETSSAGEGFALMMKDMNRALIMGEQTAGCLGQPLLMALPGGGIARICTVKTLIHGGREDVSEKGIQPDIKIRLTISDVTENRDRILDWAIQLCGHN